MVFSPYLCSEVLRFIYDQSQLLIWKQWASNPDLIPESYEDAVANPQKYPWNAAGKYKLGNAVFQDKIGRAHV